MLTSIYMIIKWALDILKGLQGPVKPNLPLLHLGNKDNDMSIEE